jgi:arginine decarboxylase
MSDACVENGRFLRQPGVFSLILNLKSETHAYSFVEPQIRRIGFIREKSELKMGNSSEVHRPFLPNKFFVTSGVATSSVSPLNAFDAALAKAKIAQCNLVNVSSILPANATMVENETIPPGTITFAVMARMDGDPGETIGAGVAWVWGTTTSRGRYGMVAEAHGYKDKEAIDKELKWKLQEMAKIRELSIESIQTRSEFLEVPKGKYGSAVVALVYCPWSHETP